MKKTLVLSALAVFVSVLVYFLWPTDESRIKKVFGGGAAAFEKKNVEEIMSRVSFNYSDKHGLSYLLLKQGLEKIFTRMSNLTVEYEITGIDVAGEKASADLDVRVIATYGKETGYFVGDAARPEKLKFFLEKERTKWLITRTEGLELYQY